MTTSTKVLLIVSVGCMAVGLAFFAGILKVQNFQALYVLLPAGASLFGVFLISKLFEKETALYEQEHHTAMTAPAHKTADGPKS